MSQDILFNGPLSLNAIVDSPSGHEIKPRIKRSNSLLQILFDITKAVVAADQENETQISTEFLKYNQFIDVDVNRHVQDFLFEMGFSISTESFSGTPHLGIKIRWPNKDTILRLVHFVIDNIDTQELFKC